MDKGRFVCQTISAHVCDRLLNRDCFRSLQTSLSLSIHFPQSDSVSELEKVHGYRDEHLDFIQQAIRKFCLNCIQTPSSVSLSLCLSLSLSVSLSLSLSLYLITQTTSEEYNTQKRDSNLRHTLLRAKTIQLYTREIATWSRCPSADSQQPLPPTSQIHRRCGCPHVFTADYSPPLPAIHRALQQRPPMALSIGIIHEILALFTRGAYKSLTTMPTPFL